MRITAISLAFLFGTAVYAQTSCSIKSDQTGYNCTSVAPGASSFQGDTTATPSLFDYVTSTNAASAITNPASHALSTVGIPAGYSCMVTRTPVSGATYSPTAICSDKAGFTRTYGSAVSALGSESWTASVFWDATGNFSTPGSTNASYSLGGNSLIVSTSLLGRAILENESNAVASAASISPGTGLFHITGTTPVSTMTPLFNMATSTGAGKVGGCVDFITDAAVTFNSGTGYGNFASSLTTSAGTMYRSCLTPSNGLWTITGNSPLTGEITQASTITAIPTTASMVTITLSANYSPTWAAPSTTSFTSRQCIQFIQNSTGGYTVTWPANVLAGFTPSTTASKRSMQCFAWSPSQSAYIAESGGVSGY